MRLVLFGCSITYGHGLADCLHEDGILPGPNPSKLGYAQLLGKQLNVDEIINRAEPGASNQLILNSILNFEFKSDDIVVIQWSFPDRDILYKEDGTHTPIACWWDKEIIKNYYLVHSTYDMSFRSLLCSHHAHHYLKSLVDNVTHLLITNHYYNFTQAFTELPKWYDIPLYELDLKELTVDLAGDNGHPGPKSQQLIANYIEGKINEQSN